MPIGTYKSIITLNVNRLNAPTKRYRLTEWIQKKKKKAHIYAAYRRPISDLDTYRLKVKGWKKIFHVNGNQKKARMQSLFQKKLYFKIKNIIRDKEGHCIMIKGSIQEEDITIVNIYTPNIGASK